MLLPIIHGRPAAIFQDGKRIPTRVLDRHWQIGKGPDSVEKLLAPQRWRSDVSTAFNEQGRNTPAGRSPSHLYT